MYIKIKIHRTICVPDTIVSYDQTDNLMNFQNCANVNMHQTSKNLQTGCVGRRRVKQQAKLKLKPQTMLEPKH